jgi:hypothetical protein
VDTPLISLVNEKREAYKKVVDLGFAINFAAYAGGLAGLVYGAILVSATSDDSDGNAQHPTLALGVFVLVLTVLTGLVLLSAGRMVLAAGRVGLRALREEANAGS